MTVTGKPVIHPAGRASTQALLRRAPITGPDPVLEHPARTVRARRRARAPFSRRRAALP
jgi:hypothetical protein